MSMEFFKLCINNNLEEAKLLFNENVNLEFVDGGGRTVIAMAAGRGHNDVVKWLIEKGSLIETQDSDKRTPLARASMMGHLSTVETLVNAGADINAINGDSRSVLSDAIAEKRDEVALFLIEKGADLNSIDNFGKMAMHHAVQNGFVSIVKNIIDKGGIHNSPDKYNNTPLQYAKQNNRLDIVTILENAESVIIEEIENLETEENSVFISESVDISETEETPLINEEINLDLHFNQAIERGDANTVSTIIEMGFDINQRFYNENGKYEYDYLLKAINGKQTEIIKILLEKGFDITEVPVDRNDNCFYLNSVLKIYCYHDLQDSLIDVLTLFFKADLIVDFKAIESLKKYKLKEHQRSYYNMILNKCIDVNDKDVRTGKTLLHEALYNFKNEFYSPGGNQIAPASINLDDIFIDALLDHDAIDIDSRDYEENPPLFYACQNTTDRIVRNLLQKGADMEVLCGEKSTPLTLIACEKMKIDVLQVLCEFGADINVANDKGFTLLHNACFNQNLELITYLVTNGANVKAADRDGNTPLHILSTTYKPDTIKGINLLIEKGADISALNNSMRTPFFESSCITDSQFSCKNIPILKHLISLGASVDTQDINDCTPLYYAVIDGDIERAKFLIDNGADSNIKNNKEESPYKVALAKNKRSIISIIEKANVSITMDGDDLDSAFMRACKNGSRGVAEMLVKSGNIDITYVDDFGRTPLHYIAKMGMTALGKFVINSGVDVNYTDNFNQTALHFAALNSQKEMFKLLIDNGADLTIADNEGVLPIHYIANNGQHDMLEVLFQKGANINTMTNHGESLLHVACYTRSKESVRILLKEGINPNILDINGVTPLIICANANQKEIAKMLISEGADVKSKDIDGDEAIHIATIKGFKDMILLLLESGSDINSLNNSGLAPLHLAAYFGFKDIFKFLLDHGADFEVKTGAGKTCIDIASENSQKELVELIGIMQKRRQLS